MILDNKWSEISSASAIVTVPILITATELITFSPETGLLYSEIVETSIGTSAKVTLFNYKRFAISSNVF